MAVKSKNRFSFGSSKEICAPNNPPPAHGFNQSQFVIMALGNIIGSGIFLASSTVLQVAGTWTPLAYLFGGLIMIWQVSFLTEMTIATPAPGSFRIHARQIFGNWWGYTIGWMFWTSGVLGMASEVTACAIFMRLWFASIPLWVFSLCFAMLITVLNLNDTKGLSKIEFGLASVKLTALILFILAGFMMLFQPLGPAANLPDKLGSLFTEPLKGLGGLMASMILILFAYTGTGIIGLAITETVHPEHIVPQATRFVTFCVVGLYTGAAFLLIALLPNLALNPEESPFVTILTLFEIPYGADVLNFILLTAALSSLNSQVYSASRMLLSLAKTKEAPQIVAHQNQKGVPTVAVLLSGAVLLLTALLSYVLPEKIFLYTLSASGVLALVNWLSVSATHYFYRRQLIKNCPAKLKYKAPGYPYISVLTFLLILAILLSAPLYPDQIPSLYAAGAILAVIGISYLMVPKKQV